MAITKSTLTIALSSAFAASLTASPVVATQNPFSLQRLDHGYMVADAGQKVKDSKCGENKCGAKKAKAKEGKGSGGAKDAKTKEAKCGSNMEKNLAGAKMKGGKCGESKCGASNIKTEKKK